MGRTIQSIKEAEELPLGTVIRQARTINRKNWEAGLFAVCVKDSFGYGASMWQEVGVDGWVELREEDFPYEIIAEPIKEETP